jgi:hypothetical protein
MCELDPEAVERPTRTNADALPASSGVFGNVASIFDAAVKREREKQAKYQRSPDNDPPPERAA